MSWWKCVNAGADKRFLWFIVCPLQHLFSFKSDKEPKWWKVWRERLPPTEYFYDIAATERIREKDPDAPMVRYEDFVTFGIAFPRWWAFYIVWQSRDERGIFAVFNVAYLGWRFDTGWRGYIFPAISRQRGQTTPLHKGY